MIDFILKMYDEFMVWKFDPQPDNIKKSNENYWYYSKSWIFFILNFSKIKYGSYC